MDIRDVRRLLDEAGLERYYSVRPTTLALISPSHLRELCSRIGKGDFGAPSLGAVLSSEKRFASV